MFGKIAWYPIACCLLQMLQGNGVGAEPQIPQDLPLPGSNVPPVLDAIPPASLPPATPGGLPLNPANFFSEFAGNTGRVITGFANDMSNILGGQAPSGLPGILPGEEGGAGLDILEAMENLETYMKDSAGEECGPMLAIMDQTIYSARELRKMTSAMRKLTELWGTVNMSNFGRCVVLPYMTPGVLRPPLTPPTEQLPTV